MNIYKRWLSPQSHRTEASHLLIPSLAHLMSATLPSVLGTIEWRHDGDRKKKKRVVDIYEKGGKEGEVFAFQRKINLILGAKFYLKLTKTLNSATLPEEVPVAS